MGEEGKRVGIFGGSFDPVHEGHLHLAKLAKESAELDEVWFLPCEISPHKMERPPTDGAERARWLRVALRDLPWARVSEAELGVEGPSYSYRTLERLDEKFPGYEWYWILGGDQWDALPRWKYPERLAELATFVVLARNGAVVEAREGYRMIRVEGEHPASSTRIREAIGAGDVDIPYLDGEVEGLMRGG